MSQAYDTTLATIRHWQLCLDRAELMQRDLLLARSGRHEPGVEDLTPPPAWSCTGSEPEGRSMVVLPQAALPAALWIIHDQRIE